MYYYMHAEGQILAIYLFIYFIQINYLLIYLL